MNLTSPVTADDLLYESAGVVARRGEDYDTEQGERSMRHVVRIFEAVTGVRLTERQGWLFMVAVKLARSEQSPAKVDHYVDLASFAALLGESSVNEGK